MRVRGSNEPRRAVEVVANGRDRSEAEQPLGGDGWDHKLAAELELVDASTGPSSGAAR